MTPPEMATLHAACFTTPRPWRAAEFSALLAAKGVFLCTEPSGFLLGRIAGPEAEILTLAVHPKARRHGIGRALLASFEATARQKGAEHLFLEVAADNRAAIALYHLAGYTESGWRRDYYATPTGEKVSARVMARVLDEYAPPFQGISGC